MRKFIWIGQTEGGFDNSGSLEGENLIKALESKIKQNPSYIMYWDLNQCEDCKYSSVEKKAMIILWKIEDSQVVGEDSVQVSIIDITENPFVVFPISKRPKDFDFNVVGLRYCIKTWIPVEESDPQIFDSMDDAQSELASLELMQPENRYEIEILK